MDLRAAASLVNSAFRSTVDDQPAELTLLVQEVSDLYDRYRAPLYRYLSSFGLTHADAEEIIQEVFLSLFQHLDRGRSRSNIPGWISRVAHNMAVRDRMRSRQASDTTQESRQGRSAGDPALNPEDRLAHSQTQERLLTVVDALPELDRQCIFLRAEGLRYREIAKMLDISLGAVAVSLASLSRGWRDVPNGLTHDT